MSSDIEIVENEIEHEVLFEENVNVGNENEENANSDEENKNEQDEAAKVVKPKRIVKNPQVVLNQKTLQGKRGIATLPKYFERVKFKGKGHEAHDLNVLMKTYEYWCHRLFPKYPFDDCIAKIEKLGAKRPAQAYIKRIRMDLLFDDDDDDKPVIDDDMVQEVSEFDKIASENTISLNIEPDTPHIDEEMLRRIEENKERAKRLRQERLLKIQRNASTSLVNTNHLDKTNFEDEANTSLNINNKSSLGKDSGKKNSSFGEDSEKKKSVVSSDSEDDYDFDLEKRKRQQENEDSIQHSQKTVSDYEDKNTNKLIQNKDTFDTLIGSSKNVSKESIIMDSDEDENTEVTSQSSEKSKEIKNSRKKSKNKFVMSDSEEDNESKSQNDKIASQNTDQNDFEPSKNVATKSGVIDSDEEENIEVTSQSSHISKEIKSKKKSKNKPVMSDSEDEGSNSLNDQIFSGNTDKNYFEPSEKESSQNEEISIQNENNFDSDEDMEPLQLNGLDESSEKPPEKSDEQKIDEDEEMDTLCLDDSPEKKNKENSLMEAMDIND